MSVALTITLAAIEASRAPVQKDLELLDPPYQPSGDASDSRDVEWFVKFMDGRGWTLAKTVLQHCGKVPVTEDGKRWVRGLCDRSGGRVVGFVKGYRLTCSLTAEEYQHWRNSTLQATRSVKDRVQRTDMVFGFTEEN